MREKRYVNTTDRVDIDSRPVKEIILAGVELSRHLTPPFFGEAAVLVRRQSSQCQGEDDTSQCLHFRDTSATLIL